MRLATALTLGRVSNLPTVWSNVLAGMILAGATPQPGPLIILALAGSLLYLAGMFLNDAFDAAWDQEHRPKRPIPNGLADVREVLAWAIGMITLALVLLALLGLQPLLWGVSLTAAIVLYDHLHKNFPPAPWIMGLCRMLLYLVAASVLAITTEVLAAGLALLAYVAGITYTARTEHLGHIGHWWPLLLLFAPVAWALSQAQDVTTLAFALILVGWLGLQLRHLFGEQKNIGRAVGGLIAGIALVDAVFMASAGVPLMALWAAAAWAAALLLQRVWAGT